uniref:Uncharacterized protein n=1 Tax=Schistosoma curassoni TaxID=6186 RepID=A0A183JFP5_9TREM
MSCVQREDRPNHWVCTFYHVESTVTLQTQKQPTDRQSQTRALLFLRLVSEFVLSHAFSQPMIEHPIHMQKAWTVFPAQFYLTVTFSLSRHLAFLASDSLIFLISLAGAWT